MTTKKVQVNAFRAGDVIVTSGATEVEAIRGAAWELDGGYQTLLVEGREPDGMWRLRVLNLVTTVVVEQHDFDE
jgi:hypothetical protein